MGEGIRHELIFSFFTLSFFFFIYLVLLNRQIWVKYQFLSSWYAVDSTSLYLGLIKLCNGIPIKYLSLIILVVQNSALILVMRYTRANVEEDKLYLASTAVVMSEVIKSIVCLVVLYLAPESRKRSLKRLTSLLNRELILNWRETAKLAFPAVLYLIQVSVHRVYAVWGPGGLKSRV